MFRGLRRDVRLYSKYRAGVLGDSPDQVRPSRLALACSAKYTQRRQNRSSEGSTSFSRSETRWISALSVERASWSRAASSRTSSASFERGCRNPNTGAVSQDDTSPSLWNSSRLSRTAAPSRHRW